MERPNWIYIYGPSACGKSTLARVLKDIDSSITINEKYDPPTPFELQCYDTIIEIRDSIRIKRITRAGLSTDD
jgi:energy-coupling factor transporter ATP-binding protein EcfA2